MKPITRKELYLNKIVGNNEYETPEKPIIEEEFFFAAILGEAVQAPEPLTRYQIYLAKIAGKNIEIPYPKTRLEYFLARAAGMEIETPTPITREEMFWADYALIVEKELSGIPPLTFNAVAGTLKNYRIYGDTIDGESVGDRTGNLFDGIFLQGYWALADGAFVVSDKWICTKKIPCKANTDYTFTFGIKSRWYGIAWYDIDGNYIEFVNSRIESQPTIFTATSPANAAFMGVDIAGIQVGDDLLDIHPSDVTDLMLVEGSTPLPYEPYGYKVPVTVEGKNLFDGEFLQGYWAIADGNFVADYPTWICTNKLPCIPNTTYTLSFSSANSRWYGFVWFTENGDHILSDTVQSPQTQCHYTATSPSNAAYMTIDIAGYPGIHAYIKPSDVTDLMLVEGSTPLPYEPYHGVTTPIYLPEQIRKVGNEVEYIDYAEQKMHRIGADDIDVTLPALPTLSGTNTLTVGIEIQPSNVYIKYKGA